MINAVVFDMFETLITFFHSRVYTGKEIAADLNIPEKVFREIWNPSEDDRTLGNTSFEEVLAKIMTVNNINDSELYDRIIYDRYNCSAEVFRHKHPDVIPMLKTLRENGIKTGLITN